MREFPLVSIIMATYNRSHFIRTALESILQQNYTFLEIIVVDDGSTDDTSTVVQTLTQETAAPIRYIQQENRGQYAAINHGLSLANGEIITFLDSDDLWPPDRFPQQTEFFSTSDHSHLGSPGIVLGRIEYFVDGATVNATQLAAANARSIHYNLSASLIAAWVFQKVGKFDESLRQNADWDWFVRARTLKIPIVADPRVTLYGRVHKDNMTRDRTSGTFFLAKMIKKHLTHNRATD